MPSKGNVTEGLLELSTISGITARRKALVALSEMHGRDLVRSKWKELKRTLNMHVKAMDNMTAAVRALPKAQQESLGLRAWVEKTRSVEQQLKETIKSIGAVVDRGGY